MHRSEIWLIKMDPTVGAEISKTRPAIIVSEDAIGTLPLKVVVPITTWKKHYTKIPWMVQLNPDRNNNLVKLSAADTFQVRSLAKERFVKKTGQVSVSKMMEIADALAVVLGIW